MFLSIAYFIHTIECFYKSNQLQLLAILHILYGICNILQSISVAAVHKQLIFIRLLLKLYGEHNIFRI